MIHGYLSSSPFSKQNIMVLIISCVPIIVRNTMITMNELIFFKLSWVRKLTWNISSLSLPFCLQFTIFPWFEEERYCKCLRKRRSMRRDQKRLSSSWKREERQTNNVTTAAACIILKLQCQRPNLSSLFIRLSSRLNVLNSLLKK